MNATIPPFPSPYRLYNSPPPYPYPAPAYDHHDTRPYSRPLMPSSAITPTLNDRRHSIASSGPTRSSDRSQSHQALSGFLRRVKQPSSASSSGLHPLLGMKPPPVLFDVRFPDSKMQVSRQWAHRFDAATSSRSPFLRLIFIDCPWTFDVRGIGGAPVTCADVFRALYVGFNVPLTDVEWALADSSRRKTIMKANAKRVQNGSVRDAVRRVDWLGKKTLFLSMTRCMRTENRWLTRDDGSDVWEVKFTSQL